MAKDYQKEIDFSFFAVNLRYSKSDYNELTPKEKAFILNSWEDKTVSDSTLLRNAVFNAINNAFRKKGKRFQELWKKKQRPINKETAHHNYDIVCQAESASGKEWVNLIYAANGINRKGGT